MTLRPAPAKEVLIYSISSFPCRREPRSIKALDPRLRGDDNLFSVSLNDFHHGGTSICDAHQRYDNRLSAIEVIAKKN